MDRWDRRYFLRAALAASAGGLLAGCGGESSDGSTSTASRPSAGTGTAPRSTSAGTGSFTSKVLVGNYPVTVDSVPWIVGQQAGVFAEAGWEIEEVISGGGGAAGVRAAVTGGIPFASSGTAGPIQAKLVGSPIVLLTETSRSPAELCWLQRLGEDALTAEGLVGKKLGVTSRGGAAEASAFLVLDQLGLTDQVELVVAGGASASLALLDRSEIDAVVGSIQLADREKYSIFLRVGDLLPRMTHSVMFGLEEYAREHPDHVQIAVDAHAAATELVMSDLDAAATAWAEVSQLPREGCAEALAAFSDVDGFVTAGYTPDALQLALRSMQLQGLVADPAALDLSELCDQTYVPEAARVEFPAPEQ